MLTQDEKKYIQKIPKDKKVVIKPFDEGASTVASEIIGQIKKSIPDLKVVHMGASGLGISGQADLDIYALAEPNSFKEYLPHLIEIFGEPKSKKRDSIAWEFNKEGYEVEFYLTDPKFKIYAKTDCCFRETGRQQDAVEGIQTGKGKYERQIF